MTTRFLALATLASATVLLAACGTTKLPEPAAAVPVETRTPAANTAAAATPGPTANATPQSQVASIDLAKDAAARAAAGGAGAALLSLPTQRVVYFDFDSYVIKDDFKPLLDGYAKVLAANKGRKLVIEGHTDERGGREYNVALGQKRAAAVVKSLTLLGASDAQLEAVSFGEERPASTGHDESAWAKNRRAELKDR